MVLRLCRQQQTAAVVPSVWVSVTSWRAVWLWSPAAMATRASSGGGQGSGDEGGQMASRQQMVAVVALGVAVVFVSVSVSETH